MLLGTTPGTSCLHPQQALGVLVVDLLQDAFGQRNAVDAPAPLRRHRGGRVVEVLVVRLEEAVVDLVEQVVEDLLRGRVPLGGRDRVRAEEDPVLVGLEELPRGARLAAELPDARPELDGEVRKPVERLRDEGEVLGVVVQAQTGRRLRLSVIHTD